MRRVGITAERVLLRALLAPIYGSRRQRQQLPDRIFSIGLLMVGDVGDTLLAGAIVPELHKAYPRAKLTAFISHANWSMVDLIAGIDDVRVIPETRPLTALRLLKQSPVDLMIDLERPKYSSGFLGAFSGARYAIGFKSPRQSHHPLLDAAVDYLVSRHEIENFRALLSPLQIQTTGMPVLQPDILNAGKPKNKSRTIVFHPWISGSKSKEWSEDNWVALALELLDAGYDIAITGSTGDYARAKALRNRIGREEVRILAGRSTLRQTAILLANAACVVTMDNEIMHLAAALGAPLVALHSATDPKRWAPLNHNAVILGEGPKKALRSMRRLSVSEVLQSALQAIERAKSSSLTTTS